jgi:hypothetical protein
MLLENIEKYLDAANVLQDSINDMDIEDIFERIKEDQDLLKILNKSNRQIIESLMEGGLL